MSAIMIDPQLRTRLNNLTEPIELREQDGSVVDRFLPEEEYLRMQHDLAMAACPYTEEQLEQSRKQKAGASLSEFWKKPLSTGGRGEQDTAFSRHSRHSRHTSPQRTTNQPTNHQPLSAS